MTANPEQFPKSSETNIPHGHEPVSPDAQQIEPGIAAPNTVQEGFNVLPPRMDEHVKFDQDAAAVRDSYDTKKKWSTKKTLGTIGVTLLAAAGIAYGVNAGATGNGVVQQPAPRPTVAGPPVPGATPPVETAPAAPAETVPTVKLPEVVPVEQQKFTDASGQEMSYEEKVAANALPSNLYKNGSEATRAMFVNMEGLLEYYPTEAEVRNNLGYPADQKLTRDDYMLAAGLYADTFDISYDSKPSTTGNSLPSVIRKILMKNVEYRYNQLNDKDTSNDSTPFDVTLTLSQTQTSFTYVDNGPNVTPDAYAITATRGMTISTGEVGNWQYPSNTMLSAKK